MAHPIDHLIEDTEKGVKIELGTLYVDADGHANLTFGDGTNWPMADQYEAVSILSYDLMRTMQRRANARAESTSPGA